MDQAEFAYCGLNCTECQRRFADIRSRERDLEAAFEKVNIKEMARAIPFMNSHYRGYKKLMSFFRKECPGCRNKGGNPFCGIRRCASKRRYYTCAECSTALCKKFKSLFKIHSDNEIQHNIRQIKESSGNSKKG
jgi:hypothetical protein